MNPVPPQPSQQVPSQNQIPIGRSRVPVPQSDLDYNMQLTNTVWGSDAITPELKDILSKDYYITDKDGRPINDQNGRPILKRESLWAIHNYYTRDLRLGNLNRSDPQEFKYCVYYLDLAGDFLKTEFPEPFMICISRVATILELSQSRGGFLRKEQNTLRQDTRNEILEPSKKSLFGGKKQE